MAQDPATGGNQAQATALLSQIPLGAIIGSPLKAAVDAQAAAAVACYDFIRNVGFDSHPQLKADGTAMVAADGKPVTESKVRDITFVFERKILAQGTQPETISRTSITVPLLTIMPLPFIRIESMTVNFKASISAMDSRTETATSATNSELKGEATIGFAMWKANVGGSISSKKDSTATNTSKYSVEHTMDISVHAVQEDMPAGLAKILSIMTDAIAVSRG